MFHADPISHKDCIHINISMSALQEGDDPFPGEACNVYTKGFDRCQETPRVAQMLVHYGFAKEVAWASVLVSKRVEVKDGYITIDLAGDGPPIWLWIYCKHRYYWESLAPAGTEGGVF